MSWKNESQRHVMSARGIKTKQIYIGPNKLTRTNVKEGIDVSKDKLEDIGIWDGATLLEYVTKKFNNKNLVVFDADEFFRIEEVEPWRAPDKQVKLFRGWAVWYGPGGEEGDCATEVEDDNVRSYQYVEGYDARTPYLVTETYVGDVYANNIGQLAQIGVDRLSEHGGVESWARELPR